MPATAERVVEWVRACADTVAEQESYLVQLDSAIGDADHGENLDRGFQAVVRGLDGASLATPADVLKLVATTLISTVGGAAGPLYGTAFLRASTAVGGGTELDAAHVVAALTAARDGVVARGKAEPGEKTMVDALSPAVEAAEQALADGAGVRAVLSAAAAAAEDGAAATKPLVARKGRASYLGERSADHLDPGAVSTALLLRTAADVAGR